MKYIQNVDKPIIYVMIASEADIREDSRVFLRFSVYENFLRKVMAALEVS